MKSRSAVALCGGALIVVLAALLRLWDLHAVTGNAFYDAAVRSMSHSWHNFFFGALEPGGQVSIDKPPLDLWLQVASTQTVGFGLVALHLPEALAGAAACALLFGALRQPFGSTAALLSALVLALLPVSVLTARSDTMDSVLAALSIAALWCSWVALRSGRPRWIVLAALIMGVAFNVKLSEALVPLPALALLWFWAAPAARRVRTLGLTALVLTLSSLSWTIVASLTPSAQRPFPIGSGNGDLWRLVLVYNGLDRIDGHGAVGLASSSAGSGPGLLRLLDQGGSQYAQWIGLAALAALLLGLLNLALWARQRTRDRPLSPPERLALALGLWFICGLAIFSAMRRLEPRYLEILAPALAAVLGISAASLLRGHRIRVAASATAILALLGALLVYDVDLIRAHRSDSALAGPIAPPMARYLRSHQGGARYELASAAVLDAVGLVASDDRPVLILNEVHGPIVSAAELQAQVRGGQVRFYFAAHECHSGPHCPGNERWAYAHSTPVAGYAGLRRFTSAAIGA